MFEREDPLRLSVVLGEGALRCAIGGPQVLRGQLEHLRAVDRRPYVQVRALPFAVGWHPALRGGSRRVAPPSPASAWSCGGTVGR